MKKSKIKILLFLVLFLAIFFRVWKIDSFPPGLYPDEAVNGNDALTSLKNGFQLFYENNNGREGLFIWIISIFFYFLNVSIVTLRLPSVIIGIFTIFGLYLLSQELFLNHKKKFEIALLSSFFLSVSFWHVNFSRIAFRGILIPFILTFSFYFLIKSFRTQKIQDSILSGIFFGLGFYTYSPFYFSVILLFLALFWYWKKSRQKKTKESFIKLGITHLLTTFLTALPMGALLLTNPEKILNRGSQVTIFRKANIIKEFFQSLVLHLGMFNIVGDWNWRHNISGKPQLLWIVGIFFLFGLFSLIQKIFQNKAKRNEKIIISWFFIMLLPGILTSEGCPHALRVIGTIPVVYILSALGALLIYQKLIKKYSQENINKIAFLVLLFILVLQFNNYFSVWAQKPETKNAFSNYYVKIGRYLNSLPDSTNKIVIVNFSNTPKPWLTEFPIAAQTSIFIENTQNKKSQYLLPKEIDTIKNKQNTVILPIKKEDENLFQKLKAKFSQGTIINKNSLKIFKIK